jgi:hypothetical protein
VPQIVELWQAIATNYTSGIGAEEMFNGVYDAAQGVCHDAFCAAIGFQGNADLVGNGVSSPFPTGRSLVLANHDYR